MKPSDDEVRRIQRVYQGYQDSGAASMRWDKRNPGNRAIVAERHSAVRRLLSDRGWLPLKDRRVLEVGCGAGAELARLLELGAEPANLYGVDLLAQRISDARARYPGLRFGVANAEHLGFPDSHFDLVMAFTLFSSILDGGMARQIATEMVRVLNPGGAVLWYDFRYDNPRNPNVRGIPRPRIEALFPEAQLRIRSTTLLPPLARRLWRATPLIYPMLAILSPLRTHYVGLLLRPPPRPAGDGGPSGSPPR